MTPDPRAQTILVIDDTPEILTALKKHLEHWGYRPLVASSGEEGLALAEAERPDLILMDVLMPRMKGRELCTRLKARAATQGIPVIFLTALGLADHVKAGLDVGAEDYVVKPFQSADLKERIKVCLLRHRNQADRNSA